MRDLMHAAPGSQCNAGLEVFLNCDHLSLLRAGSDLMHDEGLRDWRLECEAIEQEMDRLVRSPVPASAEERQVRQTQFAALVKRREDAASKLIQADRARFRYSWRKDGSAPGEYFIAARHATSSSDAGSTTFVKLPDGRSAPDAPAAPHNSSAMPDTGSTDPSAQQAIHATDDGD
jgi:hypothetical protein